MTALHGPVQLAREARPVADSLAAEVEAHRDLYAELAALARTVRRCVWVVTALLCGAVAVWLAGAAAGVRW